jgi:hypothetical protein
MNYLDTTGLIVCRVNFGTLRFDSVEELLLDEIVGANDKFIDHPVVRRKCEAQVVLE